MARRFRRSRPAPPAAGLLVPELMISLVLLATLLAVLVPRVSAGLRLQQLRRAAEALAGQIAAARAAAMQSNRPCSLQLSGSVVHQEPGADICGAVGPPPLDLARHSQLADLRLSDSSSAMGSSRARGSSRASGSEASRFRFSPGGMLVGTSPEQTLLLGTAGLDRRICLNLQRPSALVRLGEAPARSSQCTYTS